MSRAFAFFLSVKKVTATFIYNLHRIKTIPDENSNYMDFVEIPPHKINLNLIYMFHKEISISDDYWLVASSLSTMN